MLTTTMPTIPADLTGQLFEEGARLAYEHHRAERLDAPFEKKLNFVSRREGNPVAFFAELREACEEMLEDKLILDDADKRTRLEVTYSVCSCIEKLFSSR